MDTDGAYRYGVPGRLSAKFGYQDETVRSGRLLTWVANVLETKKSLAKKLHLLKRSYFYQEEFLF